VNWPGGGQTFEPGAVVRLGRETGAEVRLDNENVSRRHAELSHTGAGWVLRDLGSAQGTWVDGARTTSVPVSGTVAVSFGQPPNGVVVELVAASSGGPAGTVRPGGALPGTVLPGGATPGTVLPGGAPTSGPSGSPSPASAGGGVGTVLPGGAPDRPGGRLREGAVAGATVVTGDVLNLECAGRSYSFEPGRVVTIGRDDTCEVVTTNPTVSRRHATLRNDGSGWVFEDGGSAGGSYVDGTRTARRTLTGSTAIWLGSPDSGERIVTVTSGETRAPRRSGNGVRIAIAAVAVVVVALVGVAVVAVTRGGGGAVDEDALARGTVALEMRQTIAGAGGCSITVYGSGSVIDAEKGLVLTNAHVVKPTAEGLTPETICNDLFLRPDPDDIQLSVSPGRDRPAEPAYFGSVVAWDGYLDLAVVRIDRTIGGRLIQEGDHEELGLVEVELGDSDAVTTGDPVNVVGFPLDAQSSSATLTTGVVSGVDGDPDLHTNRALFLVDAVIRPGNSGGPAADAHGRQIGVSTFLRSGTYGVIRPVELARPLIAAAQNGEDYQTPYA
jgi:pSer/pThr/pTyr-binding forkhead associated (FHA) protein